MKSPPCVSLSPVARQILDYLSTHKDAQDTIEGIAEWWLLEQRIRIVITDAKKALDELVEQGMVLARKGQDGRVHYRLKQRKRAVATRPAGKVSSLSPATQTKSAAKEVRDRRYCRTHGQPRHADLTASHFDHWY